MASILLVDDDVGLLASLGLAVAAEGNVVRTATNGADALGLARKYLPDVVVTDCAMPVMNGVELIRALRADPALSTVPVILTSESRKPPRLRISCFIRQPFPATALLRQLHRLHGRLAKRHRRPVQSGGS